MALAKTGTIRPTNCRKPFHNQLKIPMTTPVKKRAERTGSTVASKGYPRPQIL